MVRALNQKGKLGHAICCFFDLLRFGRVTQKNKVVFCRFVLLWQRRGTKKPSLVFTVPFRPGNGVEPKRQACVLPFRFANVRPRNQKDTGYLFALDVRLQRSCFDLALPCITDLSIGASESQR